MVKNPCPECGQRMLERMGGGWQCTNCQSRSAAPLRNGAVYNSGSGEYRVIKDGKGIIPPSATGNRAETDKEEGGPVKSWLK